MKKVAFCYPSRCLGGAELLFVKCARFLIDKGEYIVYYIDFLDGYGISLLKNEPDIKHILFFQGEKIKIESDTVVITPLSYLPRIVSIFENPFQCKFLFWSIHPYNLVSYINLYKNKIFAVRKAKRTAIGKYLSVLSQRGIIRYMDYNNYFWSSKVFNYSCDNTLFLPIFVDNFQIKSPTGSYLKNNEISFLWLGRLDNDKYNTILTFINELEALSSSYKIKLYIAGYGNKENKLHEICSSLSFETIFLGKVVGIDLEKLISQKIDVGLAMGTSAFDIAKFSKPVIVEGSLEKPYRAGELNDFIILSSIIHYDVVSPGYYNKEYSQSFRGLVDSIIHAYYEMALKCAEHVYNKHTQSKVGPLLEDAICIVDKNYNKESYADILNASFLLRKASRGTAFRFLKKIISLVG